MKVNKAVIPAAGLGTKFFPITKSVPKALLTILDTPALHYVVNEALEAGITEIIIVTSPGKTALADYFNPDSDFQYHLEMNGDESLIFEMKRLSSMADIRFVTQDKPLGLGHAVLVAKSLVGHEPFAIMLPDDIVRNDTGVLSQMLNTGEEVSGGVLAVEQVLWEEVGKYGVIDPHQLSEKYYQVKQLIEKPDISNAPSNLAIVGRYLLSPNIFDSLECTVPGAKGEIQLTDALSQLLEYQEMYAYEFEGYRYDCGTPIGLLKASLGFGLSRRETSSDVLRMLNDIQAGS